MSNFSSYGGYFKSFQVCDEELKNVFSVSPYSYSINLSVFYYDKYRAVSLSFLGSPNLTLDNDLYGYSPDFYFNACSLSTLFPIHLSFMAHSYLKFRFVLPFKFYRDYSSFIFTFTRLNFDFIRMASFAIDPVKFTPTSRFSNGLYSVKQVSVLKNGPDLDELIDLDDSDQLSVNNFRYFEYITFYRVGGIRPCSEYTFRIFQNPVLFFNKKLEFDNPDFFFVLKFNSNKFVGPFFNVKNRAFCLSQFIVPVIQKFITVLLKIEQKLLPAGFVLFYLNSYTQIFGKFHKFIKEFSTNFFNEFMKFSNVTEYSISNSVKQYLVFLYSSLIPIKPFFVLYVSVFFKLFGKKTSFTKSDYLNSYILQIYSNLNWFKISFFLPFLKFKFFTNQLPLIAFKDIFKPKNFIFKFSSYRFLLTYFYGFFLFNFNFDVVSRFFYKIFINYFIKFFTPFTFSSLFLTGSNEFLTNFEISNVFNSGLEHSSIPYFQFSNFVLDNPTWTSSFKIATSIFGEYFLQNVNVSSMSDYEIDCLEIEDPEEEDSDDKAVSVNGDDSDDDDVNSENEDEILPDDIEF